MWIGGLLGSSYVMLSAQLVPVIGTEKVIIIALFGQLLVSALIDDFGWLSAVKKPISRLQIWGLILMLIAIIVINLY
nr:DMT family transporter [Lactiplantibacillus herbarum]